MNLRIFLVVWSILVGSFAIAKTSLERQYAKRLFEKMTGVPILEADPRLDEMEAFLLAGDSLAAAMIAIEDRAFYDVTVRNLAHVMSTREEDIYAPFNDFTATFVGAVRDDLDARTLLTGDYFYQGKASLNLPEPSLANNDHYRQLEDGFYPLKDVLDKVTPSLLSRDPAGLMSTRAWGIAHYNMGTNRRAFQYAMREFLCTKKEYWRDLALWDGRVRRDIPRSPSGEPQTYQRECRGCHAPMDAMAGAFARFDVVGFEVVDLGPNRFAAKYNQSADVYPAGYETVDDGWVNLMTKNHNVVHGWRGPLSGFGVGEFGSMLANSKSFSRCMVKRAYSEVCRKDPDKEDASKIEHMADDFEAATYSLKYLFARVGTDTACIAR